MSCGNSIAQIPSPVIEKEERLPETDSLKDIRFKIEFLITEGIRFQAIDKNIQAIESFLKAQKLQTSNAAVNFKLAELFLKEEKYDEALFFADEAVKNDETKYIFWVMLAKIQTERGDLSGAINSYEAMYEKSNEVPDDYLIELAAIYLYNGQPDEALNTYDKIERRLGLLEEVSTQKQKILLKQNKLSEAIQEGEKLVEAFPKIGEYAVSVAQILMSNGKNEEAIKYLENYLEQNSNRASVHMELGQLYMQTNNAEMAKPHFIKAFQSEEIALENKLNNFVPLVRRLPNPNLNNYVKELGTYLIKVHPDNSNALAATGDMYFSLQNKDSALFFYRQAIKKESSNFQLWQNILSLEMELQNYKNVVKYADDALSYFPNQPVLYLYSGSAYFSMEDYGNAILMLEQGKAIVYGNNRLKSSFAGQLGDIFHADKQFDKSFQSYEEAIEANPDNYFAINNYTYYLSLKKEKLEKAKKLSSRMVQAYPDNPTFLDTHGWVLFQLADYKGALKYLEKAVKIKASGTIIEHYGDVLYQLGDVEKAIEQWEKAKKAGDTSGQIDQKIAEKKYYE
jgi:tetratricopeptide (TPR) repeat protein